MNRSILFIISLIFVYLHLNSIEPAYASPGKTSPSYITESIGYGFQTEDAITFEVPTNEPNSIAISNALEEGTIFSDPSNSPSAQLISNNNDGFNAHYSNSEAKHNQDQEEAKLMYEEIKMQTTSNILLNNIPGYFD